MQAIHDYIAQNSVVYATQIVDRITRRSEQITEFPNSGRIVPEFRDENIREIIERPYRVIYRIEEDEANILAMCMVLKCYDNFITIHESDKMKLALVVCVA